MRFQVGISNGNVVTLDAAVAGELKLRINGKYQSFTCEAADIESVSAVCKAAQGL